MSPSRALLSEPGPRNTVQRSRLRRRYAQALIFPPTSSVLHAEKAACTSSARLRTSIVSSGGTGTFVINANDNGKHGFSIFCRHSSCKTSHGNGTRADRLLLLKKMLEEGWLNVNDLRILSLVVEQYRLASITRTAGRLAARIYALSIKTVRASMQLSFTTGSPSEACSISTASTHCVGPRSNPTLRPISWPVSSSVVGSRWPT